MPLLAGPPAKRHLNSWRDDYDPKLKAGFVALRF